jgi:hypothetical protein
MSVETLREVLELLGPLPQPRTPEESFQLED